MPHLPAAVLILIDRPHTDKQEVIAYAAAVAAQLRPVVICRKWQDCLPFLATRYILAVVSALDPGQDVRSAIEGAGGRLVVAREEQSRIRRSVHRLVSKLSRRGMDAKDIADVLDVSTADVRRSLEELRRRAPPE